MYDQNTYTVQCPYCWEFIDVLIDNSVTQQEYVEDCHVCCQPIVFKIQIDNEGQATIESNQENA